MEKTDRRNFLRRAQQLLAGMGAAAVLPAQAAVQTDPTRLQGAGVSAVGERSRFETLQRWLTPARYASSNSSWSPLGELHGTITPSALHYERHHGGIPDIDPQAHRLLVHGLVERPLEFSMDELRRFPSVQRQCVLECAGNSYREWRGPAGVDAQQTHGLSSCSEWVGVLLKHVLAEAGVGARASWLVAEGADGAAMTRSIPLAKCLDDVMLVYAQNGEALRPAQGYPLRLIVPGWEGSISVKWLRRLKLTDTPYFTREETAKYTDLMPDGSARRFTFTMDAKSVITAPSPGHTLVPGCHEIRGLAWSGRGRVTRVEISADDAHSWQQAELHGPVLPQCYTRFTLPWKWDGLPTVLASRCADNTGYVQPTRAVLIAARGIHSFYHYNGIQRWGVAADGTLSNV